MSETKPEIDTPLFESTAPSEELQELLRRIDENLELRPLLQSQAAAPGSEQDAPLAPPPALPDIVDLPERLHRLRVLRAPYFVSGGSGLGAWIRKVLNLPLRIYGVKQHLHNQLQTDALDLLLDQVQALRQRVEYDDQRARATAVTIERLRAQLASDEAALDEPGAAADAPGAHPFRRIAALEAAQARAEAQASEIGAELERLRHIDDGLHRWLEDVVKTHERLAHEQNGLSRWVDDVVQTQQALAAKIAGQSEWVTLVEREVRGLQVQVRETGTARDASAPPAPPRIVDAEAYRALLATMTDGPRVNVGCGIRPKPGWINVDARELPGVDIVTDVRQLPFEPGTLRAMEASHLVEHFRANEMRLRILPYWRSLLQPGGELTVICPDWQAMTDHLRAGTLSLADFTVLTFGGQEYEGNDHFAMYTPDTLRDLLTAAGFRDVRIVATDRRNGLCPEMELVAVA